MNLQRIIRKNYKKIKKNYKKIFLIFIIIFTVYLFFKTKSKEIQLIKEVRSVKNIKINKLNISKKKKLKNILIICNNCWNKWQTGVYGNKKNLTTNIDKFSKNSFVFNNFITTASYTDVCIYELLSSKICRKKGLLWSEIESASKPIKDILKSYGYNIYYTNSLFEKTFNLDKKYKEPFIIFHHPNDLHGPYAPDLSGVNELDKKTKNIFNKMCIKVEKTLNVKQFKGYGAILGFPTKMYLEHIVNWKDFIDIVLGKTKNVVSKNILEQKLNKDTFKYIKKNKNLRNKDKENILKLLNKLININSKLLTYNSITYKNNVLYIGNIKIKGNSKNINIYIRKQIFDMFDYLIKDHVIKIRSNYNLELKDNLTNFEKYNIQQINKCILSICFRPVRKYMIKNFFKLSNIRRKTLKKHKNNNLEIVNNNLKINIKKLITFFYNRNIKKIDNDLKNYINYLKNNNLLNNTIVVLMGDHGEELLEHGKFAHGKDICFNEIISPPLIIKIPEFNGKRIDNLIRPIDIFPTLFDIIGIKDERINKLDGITMLPAINGKKIDIYAFSHGQSNIWSVVDNNKWKLIWNFENDNKKLFNLKKDLKEKHSVGKKNKIIMADLQNKILEFLYK